jgi:hypothetical protein
MEHTAAWLAGVWQRTLLTTSDGKRDDSTRVFWLQTASGLYADLRIPADLAPGAAARGPQAAPQSDRARAQLWRCLALQEGFAGTIELRGDTCEWHRELDFQPAGGPADVGTLRAGAGEGEMLEDGEGYQEVALLPRCALRSPLSCLTRAST